MLFFLSLINILIFNVFSYPYSLPGDISWPRSSDFLAFKQSILGRASIRGDADYNPHTWNRITNVPKPAVIVQPKNNQDIINALKFARQFNIRVSVQSTGHHQDHRNIYDNSVHIDMSTMNSKSIDLNRKTLTVGPGNNFSHIEKYVAEQSNRTLVALCGAEPGVGVYGWTTGGGHGTLTRLYGLGVDALLSIDLLLANYSIITASENQNKELFRAIRGSGGGTYGIALSLTIQLFDDPGSVSVFRGVYPLINETVNEIATGFGQLLSDAPNEVGFYFIPNSGKYVMVSVHCFGNSSFCSPYLENLKDGCFPSPDIGLPCEPEYEKYSGFYSFISDFPNDKGSVIYMTSTALNAVNIVPALKEISSFIIQSPGTTCSGNGVLGGVSSTLDLDQEKTSVAADMRQGVMAITCSVGMDDSTPIGIRKYAVNVMNDFADRVLKKYSKWVYWNEPQRDFKSDDWKERYWGGMANYNRLLAVKKQIDPDNVFNCYHCIGYQSLYNDDPSTCPTDKCSCSNTPNGTCANTALIEYGTVVYKCDFDESDCNGKIANTNANKQNIGYLQSSNTLNTPLGYDLTDVTSITSSTLSNATCQIPFTYNARPNYFCVSMNGGYKCETSSRNYSECQLGKYFGIRATQPSVIFGSYWEVNISLPKPGTYSLAFYFYYNCYQTKGVFDFFASDCSDVKERIAVNMKSSQNDLYSVLAQIDLTKPLSVNSWVPVNLDLTANTKDLYLKFSFDRLTGATKGEALFGLDEISLSLKS